MPYQVLVRQPKPHVHSTPTIYEKLLDEKGKPMWGARALFRENDVAVCDCGKRFVLRMDRGIGYGWHPLRWRHRTAHRLLREAERVMERSKPIHARD